MNILIVGGCGFVGSHLALRLSKHGHKITCFDNLSRRGSEKNALALSRVHSVKVVRGDSRCHEDVQRAFKRIDIALDCAAQTTVTAGYKEPERDLSNNVIGAMNIVESCRKMRAGYIFWSTNKVYSGDECNKHGPRIETNLAFRWNVDNKYFVVGTSPRGFNEEFDVVTGAKTIYGATKFAAETLAREWSQAFDFQMISNRFSCLYGDGQFCVPDQGWLTWLVPARLLNKEIELFGFGGKQSRDCLHIDDVGDLICRQIEAMASDQKFRGEVFNVGGGIDNCASPLSVLEKIDALVSNSNSQVVHRSARQHDQIVYVSDNQKVIDRFAWKPKIDLMSDHGGLQMLLDAMTAKLQTGEIDWL